MTATKDPILEEKEVSIIVASEENMAPKPAAEAEVEIETEADQQGIDFVTLGMFIIGRLSSSYCCCRHRPSFTPFCDL